MRLPKIEQDGKERELHAAAPQGGTMGLPAEHRAAGRDFDAGNEPSPDAPGQG